MSKSNDIEFRKLINDYDILVLLETHLDPNIQIVPSDFGYEQVYRNDRLPNTSKLSGGVLVFVKSSKFNSVSCFDNQPESEQIYLLLDNAVVFGAVYIPPQSSKQVNTQSRLSHLDAAIESAANRNYDFLVVGDFNCRVGNKSQRFDSIQDTYRSFNVDKTQNANGKRLRDICSASNAVFMTGRAWPSSWTCFQKNGNGRSVVDIGFCCIRLLDSLVFGAIDDSHWYSDHALLSFGLISQKDTVTHQPTKVHPSRNAFNARFFVRFVNTPELHAAVENSISSDTALLECNEELNQSISSAQALSKEELTRIMSVIYDRFYTILSTCQNTPGKRQLSKSRKSKWFDKECSIAVARFRIARRKSKKEGTDHSWREQRVQQQRMSRVLYRKRRSFERRSLDSLFLSNNAKLLWNTVAPKRQSQYSGTVSGQEYTCFLTDIANGKFPACPEHLSKCSSNMQNIFSSTVVSRDTVRFLSKSFASIPVFDQKRNKASGADGLPAEFWLSFQSVLLPIVKSLFLAVYISGETPSQWDEDVKIPITKAGKVGNIPKELRPITLVNCITKMYEKYLLYLLRMSFTTGEFQAGYKEGYSCQQRLFTLRSLFEYNTRNEGVLYCILIDFSSFFDTVRGEFVCDYLVENRVPKSHVRAVYGMLSHVSATVQMHGKLHDHFKVKVGVRQGSVISPFLATALLQQLSDKLTVCGGGAHLHGIILDHFFFADDLVLFDICPINLQLKLDVLCRECNRLGLSINASKTNLVVFRNSQNSINVSFDIAGEKLELCKSPKYLGCTVDSHFGFDLHLTELSKKSDKAFYSLLSFQYKHTELSFDRFMYLYDRLVIPVLTYCSEITGWEHGEEYNTIFTRHLGRYLGLYKAIDPYILNWLTGTLPLEFFIWTKSYKFWITLLKLPGARFEKRALISSTFSYLHSRKSWFTSMVKIFELVEFNGDFVRWTSVDAKCNYMRFMECCSKYLISKMKDRMQSTNKYAFLSKVFQAFENRRFLNYSNYYNRRTFARMFLSMHHFEVETGRWTKTPHNHRFCENCVVSEFPGLVEIGDEEHYLCRCRKFRNIRNDLCSRLRCSSDDLIDILNSASSGISPHVVFNSIAKFLSVLLESSRKAYRTTHCKSK